MKKLREFPEWPFEQVEEVARMLYAVRPFKRELWLDEHRWKSLARQAFDFLDNLHGACDEIAKQRRELGEHYAALSAQLAETDKLSEIVPYKKASQIVTGEVSTSRSVQKLNKVLKTLPKYVSSSELRRWQNDGIPRDLLRELERVFKSEWPRIKSEQNSAKKKRRGATRPEAERRLQPALSELAELGKKVDLT